MVTLEEMFEHVDDRCSSARKHSLTRAPGVDFLDQLGLDPDVDICCLRHAPKIVRCRASNLIIQDNKLILARIAAIAPGRRECLRPCRLSGHT